MPRHDRLTTLARRCEARAETWLRRFHSGACPTRTPFRVLRDRARKLRAAAAGCEPVKLPRLVVLSPEDVRHDLDARRRVRLRRIAQSGLRRLGFARRTTSGSGSSYYSTLTAGGSVVKVRVADHDVPLTAAREHGFSWSHSGWTLSFAPDSTARKVRRDLRAIAGELSR